MDLKGGVGLKPRVYVWEFPVRLVHWVNVGAIFVLSVTGFYIGQPFIIASASAEGAYMMGTIRTIHAVTGYIFLTSFLLRVYWFFVGNKYARWRAYIILDKKDRQNTWAILKYYLFMVWRPPKFVGHNPLAGMTYQVVYLVYVIMILTGFALFSVEQHGFWGPLTGWLLVLGDQTVRLIHHIGMWLLIGFFIHHLYSAMVMDMEEANGLIGSIFMGYKFVRPTDDIKDERP